MPIKKRVKTITSARSCDAEESVKPALKFVEYLRGCLISTALLKVSSQFHFSGISTSTQRCCTATTAQAEHLQTTIGSYGFLKLNF